MAGCVSPDKTSLLPIRGVEAAGIRPQWNGLRRPGKEILKWNSKEWCDLVAMSTHGHGFWAICFSERPPDKSGTIHRPGAAAAGEEISWKARRSRPCGSRPIRQGKSRAMATKCFTVDRLADFGEDTARLSFIQTFFGAEAPTFSH